MKMLLMRLSLAVLLAGFSLNGLRAELNSPSGGGGQAPTHKGGSGSPGGGPKRDFKAELNLTPEQSSKVDALQKERQEAVEKIKADTSLSQEEAKTKIRELHKSTHEKIKAILTPEQQAKLENMKKNHGPGGPQGPNHKPQDPQNKPALK